MLWRGIELGRDGIEGRGKVVVGPRAEEKEGGLTAKAEHTGQQHLLQDFFGR